MAALAGVWSRLWMRSCARGRPWLVPRFEAMRPWWSSGLSSANNEGHVVDVAERERTLGSLLGRSRPNCLNLIRLLLAGLVIVWHSYTVLGLGYEKSGMRSDLLGAMPVNGFFVISGYLIYCSWERRPRIGQYLMARILRIYPGFWVCLIVTAGAFAPISLLLSGRWTGNDISAWNVFAYVAKNASLAMLEWRVGTTPVGVPFVTAWNASLWTLAWEFLCYLLLGVLGLSGMTRRKWILPAVVFVSVVLLALDNLSQSGIEVAGRLGRFGLFFFTGSLFAYYRNRVPVSRAGVTGAIVVVVLASVIPFGLILQAPAAGYALLSLGGLISNKHLELKNDVSYGMYIYAFPVQQLLVMQGVWTTNVMAFALVAFVLTLPWAGLSWWFVEKPALSLRRRFNENESRSMAETCTDGAS